MANKFVPYRDGVFFGIVLIEADAVNDLDRESEHYLDARDTFTEAKRNLIAEMQVQLDQYRLAMRELREYRRRHCEDRTGSYPEWE